MRVALLLATALASMTLVAPAAAQTQCSDGICSLKLTPDQMVLQADLLVARHQFDDAKPLLVALQSTGQHALEAGFLSGYVAAESGDLDEAIRQFRAVLVNHPNQTRVRLELARAMMLKGQDGGAEHNFRLAAQDRSLPPEILRTIQSSRGLLRDRRSWSLNTDFGVAPDTNITNGTAAETIDVNLGNRTLPLTLNASARQRSGVGQVAGIQASYRLRFGEGRALLVETDSRITNYKGTAADDATIQLAVGPEFHLSEDSTVSVQAVGAQRWFGGNVASRQFGLRANYQHNLEEGQRIGLSLDARHTASGFSESYSGWNVGAYATYERVIGGRFIASATLFGRRDALNSGGYSSLEFGGNLGIGGELGHGINAGLSGGLSRAVFDAPLALFSADPRKDIRLNARAYLGLRSLRFLGFSPSVTYNFSTNLSSLTLYDSKRSRFQFSVAHYF
jgi:outer membrane protein